MVKLPDAVAVFGVDHPTLKTNKQIVSYDETGDARGQQMLATGQSRELAGVAAEHGMEAQSRGIEAQAFDTDRQTAIVQGQSGMAVGKGISEAGQNIQRAGLTFQDILDKEKTKRDNLESATADSQYLTQRVNLKSELGDESDPDGLTDKYAPRTADMLNGAAAAITDPEKRKLWLLKRQADVAQLNVDAKDKQFGLLKDKTIAEAQTELDNLRNAGIRETDPEKKQEILQAGLNRINTLNDAGYIDDTKAVSLKKGWAQGYIVGNLENLSPAEKVMALDGVTGNGIERAAALIRSKEGFRESTYWDVNHHRVGYGSDTLTLPDGSVREVKQGDTVSRADAERDLARRTQQSMASVQDTVGAEAFQRLSANQQAALTSIAYNYGSLPASIASAVKSGNSEEIAQAIEARAGDNNGVNRSRRQQEAMLVRTPDGTSAGRTRLASLLPEDERRTMADKAREEFRREIVSNERAAQAEIKTQQAGVSNQITDDLASMERSGKGNDKLQRDQVVKVFGEEAAKSWDAERIRARKVFETMDGIDQLTPPEVDARLRQLEPQPGSEGYADDMKAYQRAQKKVHDFTEARAQDPALAVEALPNVKEARAAAQYDEGPDGQKRITPESAQAIVRARLIAQQHVGIEQPMAVTKAESRVIARNLRYVGDDDQKGLQNVMGPLKATYGDLAEPVLASVLQHERVSRDLSVAATEVLHQVGIKKAMPTPDQARKLDTAIESQKLSDALSGTGPTVDPMGAGGGIQPGTGAAAAKGKGETKTAEATVSGPKQANKPVDPEDVRGLLTGKLDPKQFDATYGASGLANQLIKRSAEMGYKASVMPAPAAPAAPPVQMQAPPVTSVQAGSKPYTGGFRVERTADGKIRALIPAQ